jgi:hypothetical protein
VDATDSLDVHRAIYKLYGILVGGMIPECWVNQSAPWQLSDVLNGPIAGGHEMWCYSYDEIADTYMVETWDRQQVITGAAFRYVFAEANQGEASAIVPDPESAAPIGGFNIAAAQAELQQDREAA